MNEALAISLSKLSIRQLQKKLLLGEKILDTFLIQILLYLKDNSSIAPGRKMLHHKAALVNLNTYLSIIHSNGRTLNRNHEKILLDGLNELLNERRKKVDHFTLISGYLITFSLIGNEAVSCFFDTF